ncbi:hypothetical protein BVER_01541c [Candidatus Burkholderia verschuerenii]|uniref:Uncharacterized protein n=1 Tax=Candidatus Burkholderia verschuerenii TaxID=242163 RepID=A0A0L0MI13_9BURK|nr:hypothetical protein [Candidatus Burkholderia verschuerenii]KND61940.1 hypothetical protein BVER_01541c [Candidatus Burkholderia verschuerenii]
MTTLHAYDNPTDDEPILLDASRDDARPDASAEDRFTTALLCLGAAYALSWAEFGLALVVGFPGNLESHPLAASVASRVLLALLYLCVASRLQWARWVTIALGLCSVLFVAPTIALQWHVFPAAAMICGVSIVFKLAASIYLLSPMPERA